MKKNEDVAGVYQQFLIEYRQQSEKLRRALRWLSLLRLTIFAGFVYAVYQSFRTGHTAIILLSIVLFVAFFLVIRLYDKTAQRKRFYEALVKLNETEISFLESGKSPYPNGKEYIDPHHPYSYDLDLFGEAGLFAFLNRCTSPFGQEALSNALLQPDAGQIAARQEAIQELRDQVIFRQHLQAHGSLLDTKKNELRQLKAWLASGPVFPSRSFYYFLLLFPIVGLGSLFYYFFTENETALNAFYMLFVVNLIISMGFAKTISKQLSVSTSVTKVLQQFAGQLKQFETAPFNAPLLKTWQQSLKTRQLPAFASIARLAALFNYLETIVNLAVSTILNGLFIFHVHVLFALDKWKSENASQVLPWLRILGEVEALCSFSNLAYNNKDYAVPVPVNTEKLVASEMGHPLIRSAKRIDNSISFESEKFVILTGSNMSGKSTFLRTLGMNLVLARAGSVVCAREFTFYPYRVHVSMRINDSLQDSESFFYAELKRLQAIIHELQAGEKTFIILDEILRGTNSDDKHNGTVGLIRKLVNAGACGIIATHDLTVSKLKEEFFGYVGNKCFESEIINDELTFDYRLKDGVCTKLSASFLMKKMEII